MSPDSVTSVRKLDERVTTGIQVPLLWSARAERAWVTVLDPRTGESFRLDIAADESARDGFHHPFAYRAVRPAVPVAGSELRPAEVAG